MTSDLITTDWLHSHLQDPKLRIVDCRWVLGKPGEGLRQYEGGHIPGAVHLDVDTDLSGKTGPGRHPLPAPQDFEALMSRLGVEESTHVVAYDGGRGMPAPRLWWLLRYFGHDRVFVLDGGFDLWVREGRPVSKEVPRFSASLFKAKPRSDWVADRSEASRLSREGSALFIDARAPERYRGEVEPIDARAGHIPGAKNLPFTELIDPATGRFLSGEGLKERLRALGADDSGGIICYCGSGVTACTDLLALKTAGLKAKLYEGSWSDWSRDPALPVELGSPPLKKPS